MNEIEVKNYENYKNDLIKSQEQTLLIELNKKDLNSFPEEYKKAKKQALDIAILTAKEIYDTSLSNENTTNVIYIDTNKRNIDTNSLILEQLVDQIDDSLEKLYNLEIAKEGIKVGLSYVSSGLSNLFGNYVDKGLDLIVDSISDEFVDIVGDTVIEKSIDYSLDELKARISNKINDTSINVLDKLKDTQLYLSKESKKRLLEDSKQINPDLSNAELYQLILKIIADIAIDMPVVIFIKDPYKLDSSSIAIISLLLSVSKKLKDENKNIGVSVVYAYEDDDFQPYKECDEKYKSNQKLLDEQRLFAQRYAMLERPSSDIPFVAVKSHMFVGRIDELKILKDSYYNSKVNKKSLATMEVVSSDPGVGKTKLVKKHFEQIRKEKMNGQKLIQLELLNQVGHNSLNTGLASLIKSILEEAQRIDNLKTLSQKASDKIKDSAINVTVTTIKDILDNNLIDTSKAILNRYDLNEKIKDFSQIDIEKYKNENSKNEQFEKINSAIKTLENNSNNYMPIVLFIDDLQWIDETSSEYILNHFIKKFNVHIVCTLRASDATTMLSKAIESQSLNKYKIALLEKAGVFIDNKINSTINIDELLETSDTMQFNSNKFDLKGLDLNTLTQLVSQIIEGDEEQQKTFSKSIIDTLTEDKGNVNTLFAIETINMLCDEKFYKDDIKLIIKNSIDSKIPMKFNPDIEDFIMFLNQSFKTLKSKYEESFNHPSNETFTQNFNLMAYAVLEERLNILRDYFFKHGNAAVNTLLFSSLLGTPFNSTIVKRVLEHLSTLKGLTDIEKELLKPLKEYINKNKNYTSLNNEHYEIIDEVYEILSRYSIYKNSYVYRHFLLNIFLDKQLEYRLDKLFKEQKKESNNILFTLIIDNIIIDEQNNTKFILEKDLYTNLEFYIIVISSILNKIIVNDLDIKNKEKLYDWYITIYNKLYLNANYLILNQSISLVTEVIEKVSSSSDKWKKKYFDLLWKGLSLNDRLFNLEAKDYLNKICNFIEKLDSSVDNLMLKGESYYKIGGYKYLHVSYKEGLEDLLLSVKNLKLVIKLATQSISLQEKASITLSYAYGRIGELLQRRSDFFASEVTKKSNLIESLKYHQLSLKINEKVVNDKPDNNEYYRKLGVVHERLGQTYRSQKEFNKSEIHLLKAMEIKKVFFERTNKSFSYRKILIVLHDFYKEIKDNNEAEKYILMAKETINEDEYNHDIKNLNQYHLESYFKTYEPYFKIFKFDTIIKERLSLLDSIIKKRGLSSEY